MRPGLAFLALGLVLAVPRLGRAYCSAPEPFVAPSPRHPLPPDPTLWIFSWADDGNHVSHRASVPLEAAEETDFGDLRVRELRLLASEGPVTLWIDGHELHYEIDRRWSRGEDGPELAPGGVVDLPWACSYTDVVRFEARTSAPAFEVRWPGGETLVPAHPDHFFQPHQPRSRPRVDLGHEGCFGWMLPGGERPDAERFEVTALYPDGSRVTVTAHLPGPKSGEAQKARVDERHRGTGPLAAIVALLVFCLSRRLRLERV